MKNPIFRFYADNRKYWLGLVAIIVISLFAGVFKMLVSVMWGQVVDLGVAGQTHRMLAVAAVMFGLILLDCSRTAIHYHLIGHVTEGIFTEIRTEAFRKLTTGDVAVLENLFRSGDTVTRINNDIETLSEFTAGHVSNFSRLLFQGVFALIGCLLLSWQLLITTCLVIPFSFWIVKKISIPIQVQSRKSMDNTGTAMSIAADAISGMLTAKAFALEETLADRFAMHADAAYEQTVKSEKVSMKMTGVKYVANVIQTMSLFLVGSWLVSGGILSVGSLIAFITLSNYITESFGMSDYMILQYRRAVAGAERLYEVLDIPEEKSGTVREALSNIPCQAFAMDFSYSGEMAILRNLNVIVGNKKRVAIVGESGSGKSTLMKLICRFYLPKNGRLKLFGIESANWDAHALRQNFAIVTQESILFDGSIYENIAYGKPGLTRKECEDTLIRVGLGEFVSGCENGIDYPVGEYGYRLSGGQRQRLCIARAMVKQASLILLDEATSALDNQTEKEIRKVLDILLENRAAVIVAHRLVTVQNVDYIYCMDHGKIIEEGSPQELIAQKGYYYEMCKLQGLVVET